MAITLNANHAMARSSGSNPTVNFSSTPAVNSGIVVYSAIFGTSVTSITDNQGNTYTQRQTRDGNLWAHTARAATSSGTFTVTCTSGGGDHQIGIVNFDGTDTAADPYDVSGNNGANDTSASATSGASTVTPCAVVGGLTHASGTTTLTPADTQIEEQEDAGSGMPLAIQWRRDAGATGTKASAWTLAGASDWRDIVVVLKEATGGAAQDTPELYGRPFGQHGQSQMHQVLAQ